MKLVIATRNQGKLSEFITLLADLPYEVLSLADYPDLPEVEETGTTFAANAALKAETVARATGELTMADDSGLEVDALGGRPGVYSARFAGAGATDGKNLAKLLDELKSFPEEQRSARFQAVIAVACPGKTTRFARGTCEGKIAFSPRGLGGFGYDPVFIPLPGDKTFAEMEPEEKNKISHRALALAKVVDILKLNAFGYNNEQIPAQGAHTDENQRKESVTGNGEESSYGKGDCGSNS